jgi:hypothetical protein
MIMNRNTATQRKKSILCMAQCKQRLHEIVSDQVTILHVANERTMSAYKKKVIELQRAIVRELLAYEQIFFIFGKPVIKLLAIE